MRRATPRYFTAGDVLVFGLGAATIIVAVGAGAESWVVTPIAVAAWGVWCLTGYLRRPTEK